MSSSVATTGSHRQPCFFTEDDYLRYLQDLRELSLARECRVHAYVLMTNHVHLLVTPAAAGDVGWLMQCLVGVKPGSESDFPPLMKRNPAEAGFRVQLDQARGKR